jgi:hypothetical protein
MKWRTFWLLLFALALLTACQASTARGAETPQPARVETLTRYDVQRLPAELRDTMRMDPLVGSENPSGSGPEILLTGPLAGAPAVSKKRERDLVERAQASLSSPRVPRAPGAIPTEQPAPTRKEMLDVEAHVTLEVASIPVARQAVRSLARAGDAEVVNEVVEDNESHYGAALSLRIPSARVYWLLDELDKLGKVEARKVESKDISRQVADAETVLKNLEAVLARYQQLLEKAESVADMTAIENQLARVRTAIDRVKGDLAWMRDRVARSTVYVTLTIPKAELSAQREDVKLYPGLRLPYALDFEPHGGTSGYVGGGLSVMFMRQLNFDLDLMTNVSPARRSNVDLVTTTVGVELFSDLLGGGRRKYFNPYLGFRGGYVNLSGDSGVMLGGSVGAELVKTRAMTLDLGVRAYALLALRHGTHVLVVPALALNVAY